MLTRRQLLPALLLPWSLSGTALATGRSKRSGHERLLILIELKGGNDGLNSWIPRRGEAQAIYQRLRPTLAIAPQEQLDLGEDHGLHPALAPLLPLWEAGEMAILEGLGYPQQNLSHFRSIEIWDTASKAHEYLPDGWLARSFTRLAPPARFLADAVAIGAELGPFAGSPRAFTMASVEGFQRQARLAEARTAHSNNPMLAHVLGLEREARRALGELDPKRRIEADFPSHAFGQQAKTAIHLLTASSGVAALRLGLGSFDTHQGQAGTHQALLKQFAEGVVALRQALKALGRWEDTLILTYCEFGRRPRENDSRGTDHGSANVQFAFGGALRAGRHGQAPDLGSLDAQGNPAFTTDFRRVYASVLRRWWGLPEPHVTGVLVGNWSPLEFLAS